MQIIAMDALLIKILNVNIGCYNAYKCASEKISNENFQYFISAYSKKKIKFAEQIKQVLDREDYSKNNLKKCVFSLYVKIRKNDEMNDQVILKECTSIEKQLIADYDKVIQVNSLDSKLYKIVSNQRLKAVAAIKTLESLAFVL